MECEAAVLVELVARGIPPSRLAALLRTGDTASGGDWVYRSRCDFEDAIIELTVLVELREGGQVLRVIRIE